MFSGGSSHKGHLEGTLVLSSLGWLTGVLKPVVGFLATKYLLGAVCPLMSIPDTACTLTCQDMQLDSEVALVALSQACGH